ncbi:DM13 domain-containing protein [Vibrio sp. ZSDZ65]|uniref:DM13 domain-containing protein n=1 Tax=Vibrio qingdaonensis TaxID=2829491 RepID=A0A9X3CQ20_9VIBR|nr:DM13 domain-containing protein [Vibrio qingdaonensis]MCW8347442.1 DM13 domain-containing protein [Vibrio qingdaonensis]
MKRVILLCTHLAALFSGFMLGIYILPILIQPDSPEFNTKTLPTEQISMVGEFSKDREDSDFFHWGEGKITVTHNSVMFIGELAPGPDYKLYLSPTYIETESDFNTHKADMLRIGDIKTFDRFLLSLPENTDLAQYTTAIVWCETFGEFITSARLFPPSDT